MSYVTSCSTCLTTTHPLFLALLGLIYSRPFMNVSFLYVMFYLQNVVEKKLSQMILDKKLHGELTVLQLFWNNNKVVFTIFYWIVLSFLRKVLKTAKLQGSFVCGWTWLQIISNQISAIPLWKFSSKIVYLVKIVILMAIFEGVTSLWI